MALIKVIDKNTGARTWVESSDAEQVHGVDLEGKYLGFVPKGTATEVPSAPPCSLCWIWSFISATWVYTPDLITNIKDSTKEVDSAAGRARLRYITNIPGQDLVYAIKRQQADKYAANPQGPIPSFIQAEAIATQTSPLVAANNIIAESDALLDKLASIEKERRWGKVKINNSSNHANVNNLRIAAINSLDTI